MHGVAAHGRVTSRAVLTGYAFAHLLLAGPAVALFILEATAIPLVPLTVGALMLVVLVPLTGALADVHRRMAEYVIDRPVRALPKRAEGRGILAWLRAWATDPVRWQEFGWLLVASTLGFTVGLLVVTFFLSTIWYAAYPLIFALTPEGTFDTDFGVWTIDTQQETFWFWPAAVVCGALWWWGTGPLIRLNSAVNAACLSSGAQRLEARIRDLTASRAETVDHSAAELRRIERDLHDGAQARLVALGMSLGMAEDLMQRDPEAARQLLSDARSTTSAALGDLRGLVRGIHPPVLADRGLAGAVDALAVDLALPVTTSTSLPGRPPAPVESAVYFAVAECLANAGKHAGASRAWVEIRYDEARSVLRAVVGDDGIGGAGLGTAGGLRGIARRLAAFDGTLDLSSPGGGPTVVVMEVPCALS